MKNFKITTFFATLMAAMIMTGCNSGATNNSANNGSTQSQSVGSAINARAVESGNPQPDLTRIGFAAKFTNQTADLQVAFSPYNVAGDTHTAMDCESAAEIYAATIAKIKEVSPNTTLDTVWNKDEYFNCNDGITKMIVNAINNAQKTIYAAVYDFNNPDIAYALIQKAKDPNIKIYVIADKSNLTSTDSMISILKENNIPVLISSAYTIMHNKFMVIDGASVEYGSFNYSTTAAAEQANNAILIKNSGIAQTYIDRWTEISLNESTSVYDVSQSKYTDVPYIPAGFTNVVPSEKTGEMATQVYNLSLNNADIEVAHELANYLNTSLTCPADISAIGGVCLPDYYTYTSGSHTPSIDTPFYNLVKSAKTSIQIAVFAFTDKEMVYDLIEAKKNGVNVRVIADENWNTDPQSSSAIVALAKAGIEVRVNGNYEILHNKYMIVDGQTVETGSYNYTSSGHAYNAENYQIYPNSPELAAIYMKDWEQLFDQGTVYTPPATN